MSAEATGVKKITVKFNQKVDTTTALTLTKGTAKPAVAKTTWNADATEAVIETSGKLTTGTYTVTATIDGKTLTADAVVAKDETLTSFELVGTTIKAYSATDTSSAAIQYKALNQYGEPMSCSTANVTIAPGTADPGKDRKPTASKNGEAGVTAIPDIYRIPGSKFTVVIVDSSTGVTFNGEVVYGAAASAKSAESAGLYNINKGKIQEMTAGDKPSDYKALLTVKDQYGDPYTVKKDDLADGSLSAVAASGLTNVKVDDNLLKTSDPIVTVDNVEYFAIPLTAVSANTSNGKAVAGDFSITLVNNRLGIVGTPSFTVASSVVISNIEISGDNGIYAGQENEMTYNVTDTQGNVVTSAAVLKKIDIKEGSDKGTLRFKEQTNGTAKLIYDAKPLANGLKTGIETFTITANEPTSSNYLVKTFTFTRQVQRVATTIKGVSSKVYTSTGVSGASLTINFKDLLIEDQYGNTFTSSELDGGKLVSPAAVCVTGTGIKYDNSATGGDPSVWVLKDGSTAAGAKGVSFGAAKKITAIAPATSAAVDATLKIYIDNGKDTDIKSAYELKLTKFSGGEVANVSGLDVIVNAGNAVYVSTGAIKAKPTTDTGEVAASSSAINVPIVVTGNVKGRPVKLTADEYDVTISAPELGEYKTPADLKEGKGTVTVTVNTADGPQTVTKEFKTSNAPQNIGNTIKKGNGVTNAPASVSPGAVYAQKVADLVGGYKVVNQYGNDDLGNSAINTTYTVAIKSYSGTIGADVNDINNFVSHNKMNSAAIFLPDGAQSGATVTFTITAIAGGQEVSYDVTLTAK